MILKGFSLAHHMIPKLKPLAKLKRQAVEAADWLGANLEDVFVSGVEIVGRGSINGETKKLDHWGSTGSESWDGGRGTDILYVYLGWTGRGHLSDQ